MNGSDDSEDYQDFSATSPLLGSRLPQNGIKYAREGDSEALTSRQVEDPIIYKSRWRSIRVMYFTQYLAAFTFSITMSSLWPFLEVLTPSANAGFLGWVVSSYSVGQLIASPFFGGWSNLRKRSKEPLLVSLTLGIVANMFYMYLQSMPSCPNYFMIVSRGLIGFSAGNVAVLRSYISGATTVKERTACMANVSMCQVFGFIMGPVFQAAMVPIGFPGPIENVGFHFNMYTAPAFFSAAVSLINLLLLIVIFKEHHISDEGTVDQRNVQSDDEKTAEMNSIAHSKSTEEDLKPDYVAVFSTIYLFFATLFMFTMLETIATPVTMHMYAWSKSEATFYQGFILGGGGVISLIVFITIRPLVKRYSDRQLLLVGFIFCCAGYFGFISWGSKLPPRAMAPIRNDSSPIPMHNSTTQSTFDVYNYLPYDMVSSTANDVSDKARAITPKKTIIDSYQPKISHVLDKNVNSSLNLLFSPHLEAVQQRKASHSKNMDASNLNVVLMGSDSLQNPKISLTHSPDQQSRGTSQNTPRLESVRNEIIKQKNSGLLITSNVSTKLTSLTPTSITEAMAANTTVTPEGCPWNYDWCGNTPVIYLSQYLCASLLVSIGYPLCQVFSYIIYSKVLGPAPQGLWMGWLTASGSLARTLGPIYISNMYDSFGPRVTYGSVTGLIFVTIIFNLIVYRRLVPFKPRDQRNNEHLNFRGNSNGNLT